MTASILLMTAAAVIGVVAYLRNNGWAMLLAIASGMVGAYAIETHQPSPITMQYYNIISSPDAASLAMQVQAALKHGWVIHGGVFIHNDEVHQPMIKHIAHTTDQTADSLHRKATRSD